MSNPERTTLASRWGGAAAILAGLSYGAVGYLDEPGISAFTSVLLSVLNVAIPALFLGGLLGLCSRLLRRGELSYAGRAGFMMGCVGTMLASIHALIDAFGLRPSLLALAIRTLLALASVGTWWWALSFASLTLMGMATLRREELRVLGTSVLTSGILGWVLLLTDAAFPGVLVLARPVHVAFAALFCLSAIVWGSLLFRETS